MNGIEREREREREREECAGGPLSLLEHLSSLFCPSAAIVGPQYIKLLEMNKPKIKWDAHCAEHHFQYTYVAIDQSSMH